MTSFAFADDFGPEKVIEITDPKAGLHAILVVDNTACGPAIGGCRMAPDVSLEECFRLARAMTLKNAAAGLPHGGGKSVIFGNPKMEPARKEALIRAFARAIREIESYIVGPDMGTNETAMAWIRDEIGRAVGLPRELGGVPLDEIGATGRGVAVAADAAEAVSNVPLKGARVAVQGYGAVGKWAAQFLAERGAILVAASDSRGAVHAPDGLDLTALNAAKSAGQSVVDAAPVYEGDIVGVECDILVPAARPDVIHIENVESIRAKLILQGANVPATIEAEKHLHDRGVIVAPDFIANAGGVICASEEYHGRSEADAVNAIITKISHNMEEVLTRAKIENVPPRQAAMALASERVAKAMSFRR